MVAPLQNGKKCGIIKETVEKKGLMSVKKETREEKKRREDQALNRVLWWFGGAVLLEFFLLLLNRFYINFGHGDTALAFGLSRMLQVLVWVSLAAAVACGLWWWLSRRKGNKTFLPGALTVVAAALFVCALVSSVWTAVGVQFLYLSVPATAVLALIYYLYQREFFLVALQGVIALFAMWSYRKLIAAQPRLTYVLMALCAAGVVAISALAFALQRKDGKLGKRRILAKKANYAMLYAAGGVTLCALLAALLLGATAAYWALFLVVAWLFVAAVYYTVRLM